MPKKITIFLHHDSESDRLEYVEGVMRKQGPPRVLVYETEISDTYVIADGVHRLTAASRLGVLPFLVVVGKDLWSQKHPGTATTVAEFVSSQSSHAHENECLSVEFPAECPRTPASISDLRSASTLDAMLDAVTTAFEDEDQ